MKSTIRSRILITIISNLIILAGSSFILGVKPADSTHASTRPSSGVVILGVACEQDGSPISRAYVRVEKQKKGLSDGFIDVAGTNSVGAFCFDSYIPKGDYDVIFFWPSGNAIGSQSVSITKETPATILLQMRPYKGSIEGTIFQASGKPAIGVEVSFVENKTASENVFSATTDRDGHYMIRHIAAGNYVVQSTLRGKNGNQSVFTDVKIKEDKVTEDLLLEEEPKKVGN